MTSLDLGIIGYKYWGNIGNNGKDNGNYYSKIGKTTPSSGLSRRRSQISLISGFRDSYDENVVGVHKIRDAYGMAGLGFMVRPFVRTSLENKVQKSRKEHAYSPSMSFIRRLSPS